MKEVKSKIKKKSSFIATVIFLVIIFCVYANASGLSHQITSLITSKISSAFNRQDYLEVNRDNTPKINVSIDSTKKIATVEITNFSNNDVTSIQYRLDGSEDWKDYTEQFTIKENTIIQTRYKKNGDKNYTIGSSKVVVDLIYNIALQKPIITLKQGETTIEQTQVAGGNVTVNLSSPDENDKTIVYKVSGVTRYPLNQSNLINSDGTINIENIKNSTGGEEYTKYTQINNNIIELSESGVYKIKVKATTHGEFVESEEVIGVTAIDKVSREGLLSFKTADGQNYDTTKSPLTNQNVIVTLNTNDDIVFGNNNITYSLLGATTKEEASIASATIATIENEGITTVRLHIKIGSIKIYQDYVVKIDKTAPVLTIIKAPIESASFDLGQIITIQALWNENICADASNGEITSNTAPILKLQFGSSEERTASFSNVSENIITYTYTITGDDTGSLKIKEYSGTVFDLAGNSSTVNKTAEQTWTQNKASVTDGKITFNVGDKLTGYSVTVNESDFQDWYVLGADHGKLLITTKDNVETVTLSGRSGYTGGVSTLDTKANQYKNDTYAEGEARVVKIDDIDKVTGYEASFNSSSSSISKYGNKVTYYQGDINSWLYNGNYIYYKGSGTGCYPTTMQQGSSGHIYYYNGEKWVAVDYPDNGYVSRHTFTCDFYSYSCPTEVVTCAKELLFPASGSYWLGSTYTQTVASYAQFGLWVVGDGKVNGTRLCTSHNTNAFSSTLGLRPVISIKNAVKVNSDGSMRLRTADDNILVENF